MKEILNKIQETLSGEKTDNIIVCSPNGVNKCIKEIEGIEGVEVLKIQDGSFYVKHDNSFIVITSKPGVFESNFESTSLELKAFGAVKRK